MGLLIPYDRRCTRDGEYEYTPVAADCLFDTYRLTYVDSVRTYALEGELLADAIHGILKINLALCNSYPYSNRIKR